MTVATAPAVETNQALVHTDDLILLDYSFTRIISNGGKTNKIDYEWRKIREWENGKQYDLHQVAILRMLKYLPQESRQNPAFLDKMRTALTGLYNQRRAKFDIVQLLAGMWQPRHVGVMQIYGVTARDADLDTALHNARLGAAALQGTLSNFAQAILEPLTLQQTQWLEKAYRRMQHVSVIIGQPDERLNTKGYGREGPGETPQGVAAEPDQTGQQLEMFLRAMAQGRHEFVAPIMASPVPTRDLSYMLAGVADEASIVASLQQGTDSVSMGIALPISMSANLSRAVTSAFGRMRSQSANRSLSISDGRARTEGIAHSRSHSVTEGWAHTEGVAHTSGQTVATTITQSRGSADTEGTTRTEGTAHTEGLARTEGTAHTSSTSHTSGSVTSHSSHWASGGSRSTNVGVSRGQTHSQSQTQGQSDTQGTSQNISQSRSQSNTQGTQQSNSQGQSQSEGHSRSLGMDIGGTAGGSAGGSAEPLGVGINVGVNAGLQGGVSTGNTWSQGQAQSSSQARGTSQAETQGSAFSAGAGQNQSSTQSQSDTQGQANSRAVSVGTGSSQTWSHGGGTSTSHSSSTTRSSATTRSQSTTRSESDTVSQSEAHSQANTRSRGTSISRSVGHMNSTTHSQSDTVSGSETVTTGTTRSESETVSNSVARGVSLGTSEALTASRSLGIVEGFGMGMGAIPSFSLNRSFSWEDDQAIQMTNILRAQEEQLRRATLEGAYLVDFYVLTETEESAATADAAVRQAFQGNDPLVTTPVQTRELSPAEQDYIRAHAMALTPSTRREARAATGEPYRDATLLIPRQLSAYMAPALFEEGAAVTMLERIPAYAFYPELQGPVCLGHLISSETGQITNTQARMSREQLTHTIFAADTGYGKSVAAERMALETTKAFRTQTVVLDFGAGWRKLLNAPGLEGHVEVWQLQPGAVRPLRWNPWQVGKRIRPERQLMATCEIFKNAGRMGERQLGYMRRAATEMWRAKGVLTFSETILRHGKWGHVQADEWQVLEQVWQAHGLPPRKKQRRQELRELSPWERQALAVHRSRLTGIADWIKILRRTLKGMSEYERTSLEGLLLRLEAFQVGGMQEIYGKGADTIPIEDLGLLGHAGEKRWGLSVLEGGAEMDEYSKSVILGLVSWHLYTDAVVRRRERINTGTDAQLTQIIFEEANKILSGVDTGMSDNTGAQAATAAQFEQMFRDGRKYDFFNYIIVQSPAEVAAGIMSSCNNVFVGQLKYPQDRDLMQAALGHSEKGFTDEDYKRFMSRMPIGYTIVKLGYSMDQTQTAPLLMRPLLLDINEPTDTEIWQAAQRLKRI